MKTYALVTSVSYEDTFCFPCTRKKTKTDYSSIVILEAGVYLSGRIVTVFPRLILFACAVGLHDTFKKELI